MTINVKPIEIPPEEKPDMCDLSHDLIMRAKICCTSADHVFRNIQAYERMTGAPLPIGFDELSYLIHQILETAQALADSHAKYGWVLAERKAA